ncbi:MAG TPA: 6-bladed beta-propeller [Gemmatimonadaceae bacterium]|nr:6-bladed beta-propeller [Gemmatimonadaceae bacterium]
MRLLAPRPLALLAALVVPAVNACQPGDASAAGGARTVRSTAGDTLVVRTVGGPDSSTLRLVPDLRIGQLEGPEAYTFGSIDAIAPDADGRVYVWDELSHSVRLYDADGRFVRQIGRRGSGPGEYQNLAGLLVVDGQLVFWDRQTQHASVYDSSGTLVRSWAATYPEPPMGELYAGVGGRFYLRHSLAPFDFDDPANVRNNLAGLRTGYIGVDVTGAPTGDTLPYRIFRYRPSVHAGGPRGSAAQGVPFAPQPLAELSPRGYLVSAPGDPYAVLLERRDAPPLRIERDVAPVPVSEAERGDEEARVTAWLRNVDPGWTWDGPPIPDHKPAVRRLRFDAAGRLWVERELASTRIPDAELSDAPASRGLFPIPPRRWRAPVVYDLFEPDGRFLGTVERPRGATFLHMSGDTVWGAQRDSLDVPYVMRWHLEPSVTGTAREGGR